MDTCWIDELITKSTKLSTFLYTPLRRRRRVKTKDRRDIENALVISYQQAKQHGWPAEFVYLFLFHMGVMLY